MAARPPSHPTTDVGSIPIARSMFPAVCARQTLRDIRTPLFRAWIPVEMVGECQGWTFASQTPLGRIGRVLTRAGAGPA